MAESRPRRLVGRCPLFFFMAVCFDLGGITLILIGVFVDLQLDGRSFGEFIIYAGGILIFFSLLWWLAWYSFNLEISMEDLMKDTPVPPQKSNLVQLARKFSERFSKRSRRKRVSDGGSTTASSQPVPLTPIIIINGGYSSSQVDFASLENKQPEVSTVSRLYGQLEAVGVPGVVDRLV